MKIIFKIAKPSSKSWSVRGKDLDEVRKALDANGWWGRYNFHMSSKYSGKSKKIDTITVTAKPVILMPKWPGYGKATKDDRKLWDTMWKELKKHEGEHHAVFEKAAREWKVGMEKGGDLELKEADRAFNIFGTEAQKLQDAFDKKTGHGAKTGVKL